MTVRRNISAQTSSPHVLQREPGCLAQRLVLLRSCLHMTVALLMVVTTSLTGLRLAQASHFGDIETFASVPAVPGFPEGIAVHGKRVYLYGGPGAVWHRRHRALGDARL
jgi:hypothetical protein